MYSLKACSCQYALLGPQLPAWGLLGPGWASVSGSCGRRGSCVSAPPAPRPNLTGPKRGAIMRPSRDGGNMRSVHLSPAAPSSTMRQMGHVRLLRCHSLMQGSQNTWPQCSVLVRASVFLKSSKQMGQDMDLKLGFLRAMSRSRSIVLSFFSTLGITTWARIMASAKWEIESPKMDKNTAIDRKGMKTSANHVHQREASEDCEAATRPIWSTPNRSPLNVSWDFMKAFICSTILAAEASGRYTLAPLPVLMCIQRLCRASSTSTPSLHVLSPTPQASWVCLASCWALLALPSGPGMYSSRSPTMATAMESPFSWSPQENRL
mmetsp:Transcript_19041/g.53408  ORF Transcript_19041/g.53408 Transcript_19041/m.53408 type:complete len:321 (-) Transcript_19041:168-1130(-)